MCDKLVTRFFYIVGLDYYIDDEDMRDSFKHRNLMYLPLILYEAIENGWYNSDGTIINEKKFFDYVDDYLKSSTYV